ncbi:putative F-box/FBD/LRR-repeat protein At4g03220 [Bidens hawaiensis]|uniref:putative F-box/FBD/LRR-repeat protein At4g03220 n=1 Tax=Bidens hawaiensis TaxID=980011 RepID=UPI00404A7F3D
MKRKFVSSSSTSNNNNHGDDDDDDDQQQQQQEEEDRLSLLPDVLLIYIFSFIDTKLAVQASLLSKRWVNLWSSTPVLNFNSSEFISFRNPKPAFDSFIDNVLATRNQLIKLDSVSIKTTDHNALAKVLNYAGMHRVGSLNVDMSEYLTKCRPISFLDSLSGLGGLLKCLRLKGMLEFGAFPVCSGLVSLRLERVKIVVSEPFSCFPNLRELFLVNCKLECESRAMEVIGFRLTRLTISSCFYQPIPYEKVVVLAPKLEKVELEGLIPMEFEASDMSELDTVYVDCCFSFQQVTDWNIYNFHPDEYEQKVNLIRILWCLRNAKCVHLSPSTIKLLSLSHSMLDEEQSPFVKLKVLNLIPPPNKPVSELLLSVANYLLKGSPEAVVKSLPWW